MRRLTALFVLGLACCLAACAPPPVHVREGYVFGTRIELTVAGGEAAAVAAALGAVQAEFDRLHRRYHAWQPSELTALNAALAAGRAHPVDDELATLIDEAARLAARGEYLFDPGIGRLVALWGFHADEFRKAPPDAAALAAWRAARPSIADLQRDGHAVRSRNPAVALDFGGYLKGVALDRAAAILRAHGLRDALINIGGNVLALGSRHGRPWRIGLQHPRQPGPLATLELADGEAIGTSGDYQRYFEHDGQRYCHLLDPRTAAPVPHTQAVTVLIPAGATAGMRSDATSKPIFIAGPADWRRLARTLDVPAVLRIDADGSLHATPAMAARLTFHGARPPLAVVE